MKNLENTIEAKSAGEHDRDREERLAKACERIGSTLEDIWQQIQKQAAQDNKFAKEAHFVFRFRVGTGEARVWVDARDHSRQEKEETARWKSFAIRFVPPEAHPQWSWVITKVDREAGVKYEPAYFEYDELRKVMSDTEKRLHPEVQYSEDPTLETIEEVTEALEGCRREFTSGRKEAIEFWSGTGAANH